MVKEWKEKMKQDIENDVIEAQKSIDKSILKPTIWICVHQDLYKVLKKNSSWQEIVNIIKLHMNWKQMKFFYKNDGLNTELKFICESLLDKILWSFFLIGFMLYTLHFFVRFLIFIKVLIFG